MVQAEVDGADSKDGDNSYTEGQPSSTNQDQPLVVEAELVAAVVVEIVEMVDVKA